MRIRLLVAVVAVSALLLCLNAQASVTLLNDDFNGENGGSGVLNYTTWANWDVTAGAVDLIGNGFYDFYPGNGLYVDLDGSTSAAGTMKSSSSFGLVAGQTYQLQFDLGGSTRGDTNTVHVSLGTAYTEDFTMASADPLTTITRSLTIGVPDAGLSWLQFKHDGGDNYGLILDNVKLVQEDGRGSTPELSTWMLLACSGLAGLGLWRRRKA
jgi:MYXO-CTERM domain-containing protein